MNIDHALPVANFPGCFCQDAGKDNYKVYSFVYVILEGLAKVVQARSPTGSEMSQQDGSGRPGRIQNTYPVLPKDTGN